MHYASHRYEYNAIISIGQLYFAQYDMGKLDVTIFAYFLERRPRTVRDSSAKDTWNGVLFVLRQQTNISVRLVECPDRSRCGLYTLVRMETRSFHWEEEDGRAMKIIVNERNGGRGIPGSWKRGGRLRTDRSSRRFARDYSEVPTRRGRDCPELKGRSLPWRSAALSRRVTRPASGQINEEPLNQCDESHAGGT